VNGLPPSLRDRVLGAVSTRSAVTRKIQRVRLLVILLALVFSIGASWFIGRLPANAPIRPAHYIIVLLVACSIITLATAYLTHGPTPSPLGRSRGSYHALAIATPLGLALAALGANLVAPSTLVEQTAASAAHFSCLTHTITAGSVVLAALLVLERRSIATAAAIKGASMGAVAGAWATLFISIRCPHAHPLHVVPTHILPIVLLVVVGMTAGARALSMRSDDASETR
jgi:hypothetical protein